MSSEEFTPPKKTLTIEFFVGLFALIGCLCFGYLAVTIGGMSFFGGNYYSLSAEFDNISGLEPGANVELAGVPIGNVSNIDLNDTTAIVTMSVRQGVIIRDDDIAAIRTKGIIGDRYVKIIPGGSEDLLKEGGSISDTDSVVELEEVIGKFIHSIDGDKSDS